MTLREYLEAEGLMKETDCTLKSLPLMTMQRRAAIEGRLLEYLVNAELRRTAGRPKKGETDGNDKAA